VVTLNVAPVKEIFGPTTRILQARGKLEEAKPDFPA
jgi:hypothetical protein